MAKRKKSTGNRKAYLALAVLIVLGFATRLLLFSGSQYPSGDDGGYYVYYTQSVLDGEWRGSFLEPSPVIFYASAFFGLFAGANAGVTIATCIFSSLAGLSAFILFRHLFKSHMDDILISMLPAALVIFSGCALFMDSDYRKSVAAAFFIPLVFYLFFRSCKDRRYLLPLVACGALAVLSHKTAFVAGLVLLSYFLLSFVLRKKIPRDELVLFVIISAAVLLAVFAALPWLASQLDWLAASPGAAPGGFEAFWYYLMPAAAIAPIGLGVCLKRLGNADIFLIAWSLTLLLLSLPQVTGWESYRFTYLLIMPLAMLSAIGVGWLKRRSEKVVHAIIAILIISSVAQFAQCGATARSMGPVPNDAALSAIEGFSHMIPEGARVYSDLFRNDKPNYWINGVFFGRDKSVNYDNIYSRINSDVDAGKGVYMVHVCRSAILPAEQGCPHMDSPNLRLLYNQSGVLAFKVAGRLPVFMPGPPGNITEGTVYDFNRLTHPSSWLILPYEIMYIIDPQAPSAILALVGIPLSILWLGLLMLLVYSKARMLSAKQQRYLIIVISALAVTAVFFNPGFL